MSVGFVSTIDVVNQLRLPGNNLVADPTRNLLWVSIPATVDAPLGKTVISVNPSTGLMSDPIALNASPMANSMALSAHGRYLYVGLSDVAEISRIDLTSTPPTIVRVPLGLNGWGDAGYAADIEVLDGNGTSILATTTGDESALVIDGTVRRTTRTGIYTVNRIERTSTAGVFIGYDNAISSYPFTRLSVTASGVAITQTVNSLVTGFSTEIRSSANITLSSGGQLVDSNNLTLKSTLGVAGRPCVDATYQRAYLVNGASLRAFDTTSGAAAGTMALPTTSTGDWAQSCIRWGADGFAILGTDKLYLARWSATIPAGLDANNNGLADNWEATNFGALGVNPAGDSDSDGVANAFEYLFATSTTGFTANPMRVNLDSAASQNIIHLTFPRRAGLSQGLYGYECSANLVDWAAVPNVSETVVSSQTVNGVLVETVDAQIPSPAQNCGFVRLRWIGK